MSVLLHFSGGADTDAATIRCASALASALTQHAVPLAAVVESESAADSGLYYDLQPLARKVGMALLVSQPSQLVFALRSALAQLGSPPDRLLAISLSLAPGTLFAAAAALRCAALHAPPADPASVTLAALQHFAQLMRREARCLVVGHVMKRSRQLSLTVEGMLPLLPRDGLCFVPLDISRSLAMQQPFDILLQKPTDYMEAVPGSGSVPGFTTQMQDLHAQLAALPHVCIVDPLARVQAVLDRAALAALLDVVCAAAQQAGIPLRSPRWLLVQGVGHGLQQQLAEVGMQLPIIVKPQVACGVSESHQMAFLLHLNGLRELQVPLPAVFQEYEDHGGLVWKVYVAGDKVFMTQRKSTPDLRSLLGRLASEPHAGVPATISFDSLKSLPTALPWGAAGTAVAAAAGAEVEVVARQRWELRQGTAELVAGLLRQQLQLTLFGFDIIISDAGELVIIDVNFFPSFKGIPEAPHALRAALLARHREHLGKLEHAA